MTGRVSSAAALILLPLWAAVAQTYLGSYTGTSTQGKTVTVHAGASSVRVSFYGASVARIDLLTTQRPAPDSSFAVVRDTSELISVEVTETDSSLIVGTAGLRILFRKNP